MKDEIKDLIYSIANGNASDSEDLLNSIMAQKAVSGLDAFRIEVAKSMFSETEGIAEGKDNLESLQANAKQISDKIDSIVQSGGRVGLNDPLSRQLKAIRNKIKQAKQGMA